MNTCNHSINFLVPNHKYQLYRVTKTIYVLDPQRVLPQTSEPSNVLIYHGTHPENQSYTPGSPTEMPISKKEAHPSPIIYNSGNLPTIFNNQNGLVLPYTSTSVQNLFKTQACIPGMQQYVGRMSWTSFTKSIRHEICLWRALPNTCQLIDSTSASVHLLRWRIYSIYGGPQYACRNVAANDVVTVPSVRWSNARVRGVRRIGQSCPCSSWNLPAIASASTLSLASNGKQA